MDYNSKYLKYKEKYLALKNQYNQLKNMKGGGNKINVILFKADWCGHCKNFKPTWEKVSKMYENKYNFIVYDADTQKKYFEEYKVDAFPTVLIKTDTNTISYDGDRSFDDFSNFLQSIN